MFEASLRRTRDAVSGARTVMLVDGDGMVVSAVGEHAGDSLELIAASYMDLSRRAADAGREGGFDPPREMTVSGGSGTVVIRAIGEGYGLVAVLEPESLVGRARFELRKLEARLAPELEV
jgi:predicted regulator of Ras-like GTPase activity (Roadblock/LC7/MglB family)